MVSITPGNSYTFQDATDGRRSYGKQAGTENRYVNYDVSSQEVESYAFTGALSGGNYHCWAEVWKEVEPTENGFINSSIETNYRAALSWILATCRFRLRIFIYDVQSEEYTDVSTIEDHSNSDPLANSGEVWENTNVRDNVSGSLEADKKYRIGIRTDSWASGVPIETAISDVSHPDFSIGTDGYFDYNSISIEWPNM